MATTTGTVRRIKTQARPGPLQLVGEGLREIWSRRQLARYLVHADMIKHGANTVLGNIWWILDPLLQMAIYVIFVSVILKRGGPDYPLFVFAAILPWKWFSTSINDAILSVTSRESIIKQVKFPTIVLPVAATVSGVVSFVFGLIPLFGMMIAFYADRITPYLVLIPVVAFVQFFFTLSLCIVCASINVFFRDLGNLARHFIRLWFYLSPALYGGSEIDPNKYGVIAQIYKLNPWVPLFESYHNVIYNGTFPDWAGLGALLVVSFGLIAIATLIFKRLEPAFAKVI
ncbi:MAG TPA: ABC transporter permease [Verrucomicrobiae bacterium]|nr:ABC transporter permease [Verrucomicrobiae bacterium]